MSIHFVPKFLEHELGRVPLGQESLRHPLSEYDLSDSSGDSVDGYTADDEELGDVYLPEATPERPERGSLFYPKTVTGAKSLRVDSFRSLIFDESEAQDVRDVNSGCSRGRSSSIARQILILPEDSSSLPEPLSPPKASLGKVSFFPHQDPSGQVLLTQLRAGLSNPSQYLENDIYFSLESYRIRRSDFVAKRPNFVSQRVMGEMNNVVHYFMSLPKEKQNLTSLHRSLLIDVIGPGSESEFADSPSTPLEFQSRLTRILSDPKNQPSGEVFNALITYETSREHFMDFDLKTTLEIEQLLCEYTKKSELDRGLTPFDRPLVAEFLSRFEAI